MDIELFKELQEDKPVFDQRILDGLAYSGLGDPKVEVDRLIGCAERSFPEGFVYLGSHICSPQEAYLVMASIKRRGEMSVDMAPSDVVLCKYEFEFEGVRLKDRYFFLPFFRKGGFIKIAGKQFAISPVLADPGFSVGEDYVFIRMNRAPVNFKRMIYTVDIDGHKVSKYVVHSKLHHRAGNRDRKNGSDDIHVGRVNTTIPHYLFCKYGPEETFRKFGHAEVHITTDAELDANPMDPEQYTFIRSRKVAPATLKKSNNYSMRSSPVVLVFKKGEVNHLVQGLAAGFFYMVDHFPEVHERTELVDQFTWKLWLAYVLFGDQLGFGKLVENVDSHLTSLDDYVDVEVRQTLLNEEDLEFDDIYQLCAHIQEHMDEIIERKGTDIASMYGKRLMTSNYVLRDIFEQIFRCVFEITKNRKRKLGKEDYNKLLGKYFIPEKIHELRNTAKKAYVSSVSSPSDNMFFKVTSRLVMQAHTGTSGKSQNVNVHDPMSHLHASTAECGNYVVLPRNSPLARNTINPTARLDEKMTLLRKPHMRDVIDYIDEHIRRT